MARMKDVYTELYTDIEELYEGGVDARRIAEILDISLPTVYQVLEDMGVSRRPQPTWARRRNRDIQEY